MEQYAGKSAGPPVRVVIPAEVAFNIAHLHETLDNLAQTIGHPECTSGRDVTFETERAYIVDPANRQLRGLSKERF